MMGFGGRLILFTCVANVAAVPMVRTSHPHAQTSLVTQGIASVDPTTGESFVQRVEESDTTKLLGREAAQGTFAEIDAKGSVDMVGQEPHPAAEFATKALLSNHGKTSQGSDLETMEVKKQMPDKSKYYHPDDRHGAFILPIWAQVVIGTLTCTILMSLYFCIKSRFTNTMPGAQMDSERLHIVLQETIERVKVLKAELDERYQEQEPMAIEGEIPEVTAARVHARSLKEKTEARSKEIIEAATQIAQQREHLAAGAERAQEVFSSTIDSGRERMEAMARGEATGLYKTVEEAVAEGNIPAWRAPEWMAPNEDEAFLSLPPLMNLIQGALATRSIQLVKYGCNSKIMLHIVMCSASVWVFATEWKKHCVDREIWVWHIGILVCNSLDLLGRLIVVWWCSTALSSLKETRNQMDKEAGEAVSGNLFEKLASLKRGTDNYFESYFKYHNIVESWLYLFLQLIMICMLLWGAFGVFVSVHEIVPDSLTCHATKAITYMHCYAFAYVLLLTWNVMGLLVQIVGHVSSSRLVSGPILRAAKSFDDSTMQGIPFALTLVESVVLKNSAGSLSMSQREVKNELRTLTDELEAMDWKLLAKKRASEKIAEVAAQCKTQEEYMDRYQVIMDKTLKQAKPLVGLLAANVRTEDEVANTTAASSTAAIRMAENDRRQRRGLRRQRLSVEGGEESEEDPTEAAAEDVEGF